MFIEVTPAGINQPPLMVNTTSITQITREILHHQEWVRLHFANGDYLEVIEKYSQIKKVLVFIGQSISDDDMTFLKEIE